RAVVRPRRDRCPGSSDRAGHARRGARGLDARRSLRRTRGRTRGGRGGARMDRGLISLKFAMLRNSSRGLRLAGWVIAAVLVASTWAAGALAANDDVRHSILTLVLALWLVGGMFGPVLMSGAGVLRPDYFSLL